MNALQRSLTRVHGYALAYVSNRSVELCFECARVRDDLGECVYGEHIGRCKDCLDKYMKEEGIDKSSIH